MKIEDYLFANNLTYSQLAPIVDCSIGHLIAINSGKRRPSRRLVAKVHEATSGQVQLKYYAPKTKVI